MAGLRESGTVVGYVTVEGEGVEERLEGGQL